jgi:hypothetical protein
LRRSLVRKIHQESTLTIPPSGHFKLCFKIALIIVSSKNGLFAGETCIVHLQESEEENSLIIDETAQDGLPSDGHVAAGDAQEHEGQEDQAPTTSNDLSELFERCYK